MNLKFTRNRVGTKSRALLFLMILASLAAKGQAVVATYTSGDIPTFYVSGLATITTTTPCPGTLSITIPAGNEVTGLSVVYSMTAADDGWISEQRSYMYSSALSVAEAAVTAGTVYLGGTFNYSRSSSFANGATGTFDIELRAFRTYGGNGTCGTLYNKVDNNSWTITVNYAPIPLKIALADIGASNYGVVNKVNWKTQSEETGDRFEVERSFDGRSFALVATVNAKGIAPAQYAYTDEKPYEGTSFYRLKMVDKDGKTNYSKTVTAEMKINGFMLHAFPNPVNNEMTVSVRGGISGKGRVSLVDAVGRQIRKFTVDQSGVLKIPMTDLSYGIYLLQYEDGSNKQTLKVNKH